MSGDNERDDCRVRAIVCKAVAIIEYFTSMDWGYTDGRSPEPADE